MKRLYLALGVGAINFIIVLNLESIFTVDVPGIFLGAYVFLFSIPSLIWFIFEVFRSTIEGGKLEILKEQEILDSVAKVLEDKSILELSKVTYISVKNLFIGFDETNRKVIIGGYNDKTKKVDYHLIFVRDILSLEIIENGKGLLSTSSNKNILGLAAIGGIMFGGAGAVVGAITGSVAGSKINEISIKIFINDIDKPYVGINLLEKSVSKGSDKYNEVLELANNVYGMINVLIEREK
ncbi:MAG: hypothetical protein P9L97_10500 [Candidatus Tenebribacter davisii]|nr:hypothetical protein [Candidatus Tenebribacter davisii]